MSKKLVLRKEINYFILKRMADDFAGEPSLQKFTNIVGKIKPGLDLSDLNGEELEYITENSGIPCECDEDCYPGYSCVEDNMMGHGEMKKEA